MRIGLVYRHFALTGSIERLHVELARYLVTRGHEVHVYSIAETRDASLAPGCVFHDVPVTHVSQQGWSARELFSFARNAAALLRRETFDVLYTRLPSTWVADILYLPGVLAGEVRGRANWWHWAAGVARRPGLGLRYPLELRAVRNPRVGRFHVDSRQVRADLIRDYKIHPDRITVVPPGINLEEFRPVGDRPALRRELGLPAGGPVVLFCGHDFARKGLDRAITALAQMRVDANLVVVGGGPRARFAELADRLAVGHRVRFAGPRSDAARFYQAADVAVLPTRFDYWGASVVEAMACGTPPVVTHVAGSAESVSHGETGHILAHPFDVGELAGALDDLLSTGGRRSRMALAGIERAKDYGWDRHGARVEADMQAVARSRGGPRG